MQSASLFKAIFVGDKKVNAQKEFSSVSHGSYPLVGLLIRKGNIGRFQ